MLNPVGPPCSCDLKSPPFLHGSVDDLALSRHARGSTVMTEASPTRDIELDLLIDGVKQQLTFRVNIVYQSGMGSD